MLIKKVIYCIALSLIFAGPVMSEKNGSPALNETSEQTGFSTLQRNRPPPQNIQKNTTEKNDAAASGKQPEAGKKPSMIDFCRKNPC